MIRFTGEYLAGIMVGCGLALLFVGLAIQGDLLTPLNLKTIGFAGAGVALLLGGGGWKLRLQSRK